MPPSNSFIQGPEGEDEPWRMFPRLDYSTPDVQSNSFGSMLGDLTRKSESRINGLTSDRDSMMQSRDAADDPAGWKVGGGFGSLLAGALGGYLGGQGTDAGVQYAAEGGARAGETYFNNLAAQEKELKITRQKDVDTLNTLLRDEVGNNQNLAASGVQNLAKTDDATRRGDYVGTQEYTQKNADELEKAQAVAAARANNSVAGQLVPLELANMALTSAGKQPLDPTQYEKGVPKGQLDIIMRGTQVGNSTDALDLQKQKALTGEAGKLGGTKDFLPWIGTTTAASAKASTEMNAGTDGAIIAFKQLQDIYRRNGGTPQSGPDAATANQLIGRIFTGTRGLSQTGMTLNAGELPILQAFSPDKSVMDQRFVDTIRNAVQDKNSEGFITSAIKVLDRERITKDLQYGFYHKDKKALYDELGQIAPEVYAPFQSKFSQSRAAWDQTAPEQTMFGAAGTGAKPPSAKVQRLIELLGKKGSK